MEHPIINAVKENTMAELWEEVDKQYKESGLDPEVLNRFKDIFYLGASGLNVLINKATAIAETDHEYAVDMLTVIETELNTFTRTLGDTLP